MFVNRFSEIFFGEIIDNIEYYLPALKIQYVDHDPILSGISEDLPKSENWERIVNYYLDKTKNKFVLKEIESTIRSYHLVVTSQTDPFHRESVIHQGAVLNEIKKFYSKNKDILDFIIKNES